MSDEPRHSDETLDQLGAASFPASDPPQSWTWEVPSRPAGRAAAATGLAAARKESSATEAAVESPAQVQARPHRIQISGGELAADVRVQPTPPRDPRAWCPSTVVVGHDGSAASAPILQHAAQRAGPGGYLIVVHALPSGISAADAGTAEAYVEATDAVLGSIEGALPEGVPHETRIVAGPAWEALLETARRYDADEIVLGAASGRVVRGAVGQVTGAVLRRSPLPVTIIPRRT